jgi:hypothetical protein
MSLNLITLRLLLQIDSQAEKKFCCDWVLSLLTHAVTVIEGHYLGMTRQDMAKGSIEADQLQ